MAAVAVGGDSREFAHPALPSGGGHRKCAEAFSLTVSALDCLLGQRTGPRFHCPVPLGQCLGYLEIV